MMCMDCFSDSVMLLHALCCKLVNLQESVSAYICTFVSNVKYTCFCYFCIIFKALFFFQTCALLCDFGPTLVQ